MTPDQTALTDPFQQLQKAEYLLAQFKPTGSGPVDFDMLSELFTQERVLDRSRSDMYENNTHGSTTATDYLFREYMVRHLISLFALKLDRSVTDRITGEEPNQKSAVAIYCKDRTEYPKPTLKAK